MEAAFVVVLSVVNELLGHSELLGRLGVATNESIAMHADNQAVLNLLEGGYSSGNAKHTDVRVKFVKGFVQKGGVLRVAQHVERPHGQAVPSAIYASRWASILPSMRSARRRKRTLQSPPIDSRRHGRQEGQY
ncbi:hypothetical protein P3T76_002930 [Phytophthora citrophthora]|uniref:Uncharacterized protein n=1 Tax=Phytophthora citrophthora TaxID=4793 RepID=A0AAD9GWE2_9STRA|nr:hypothetical protein P3T76_002930 [Phytophthora citrophthora]